MADRAGGKAGDAGTKVDQPSDRQGKGTPDKEALETTEATQAVAQEEAAEKAAAPKPRRRKPKAKPEAEGTAADATDVQKDVVAAVAADADVAEAATSEPGASDAQASDEAATDTDTEPQAIDVEEADETPAAQPVSTVVADRVAEPRPRGRGAAREPGATPPVVRAQAKYVRTSARKARLVCDHIRGKSVDEARAILAFTPRAAAKDWAKLLNSAVANAEHNHELLGEDLKVDAAYADEGPTLKRFQPRAMGRATSIRKRTSHLTIMLTPKG
jgi:ribosomal protein L22